MSEASTALERQREAVRRYRARDPERARAQARASMQRSRERDPEKHRAADRRNREANPETDRLYRKANPEVYRAAAAREKARYPERVRERNRVASRRYYERNGAERARRRRARQAGAFVERIFRSVVWERDGGICGICKLPVDPANWHLDHIVPLARDGEHSYRNVQVTHPACNLRKGAA